MKLSRADKFGLISGLFTAVLAFIGLSTLSDISNLFGIVSFTTTSLLSSVILFFIIGFVVGWVLYYVGKWLAKMLGKRDSWLLQGLLYALVSSPTLDPASIIVSFIVGALSYEASKVI